MPFPQQVVNITCLFALNDLVFARPQIKRYLASGRRLDFSNDDIFRRYPELDG
jgi:glutathione S-transferase